MARGGDRDRDRDRDRRRGGKDLGRRGKKRVCIFCKEHIAWVDYKDVNLLRRFMSDRGKIRARRVSGNCSQHQREVAIAIKTARELALLPYAQRTLTERGGSRGRSNESFSPPRPPHAPAPPETVSGPAPGAVPTPEPDGVEPDGVEPDRVEPDAAGPDAAGPDAAVTAEPVAVPDGAVPDAAGPDAAGPDAAVTAESVAAGEAGGAPAPSVPAGGPPPDGATGGA